MKNYFQKILSLFTKNEYSESTQQQFYKWLTDEEHADAKEEALIGLWNESRKQKGNQEEIDKSFKHLSENINIPPIQQRRKFSSIRLWQSAAAVLFIFAVSSIYLLIKENNTIDLVQEYIPTAEMRSLVLPDGSEVLLNSQTTLLYPQQFTGKSRSVFLIGEANFKIKQDSKHPFIVKSNNFQVTALGTEFNVSAYPGSEEVAATLISGSVRVDYNNLEQSLILTPGEQFVFNPSSTEQMLFTPDIADVTAWQRDELVFQKMTVKDIITMLERKFNYSFVYSIHSLKDDRYSFRFHQKASLNEVMDIITSVTGNLKYRIEGDTCTIYEDK